MGITTYLFHSSEGLEKQKFDMFFLDMGENIHFHYRDLRIELSVGEFQQLAELFALYSQKVLQEIEAGYQDGVLANTNEEKTLKTFWDKERKLTCPVKYHEQRLVVEEATEGYHLHIRNYKILLHKESFLQLVKAMAPILPLLESGELQRDPVQLLADNELGTRLISRLKSEKGEEIFVEVDKTFRNKAGQVLRAIGYSRGTVQEGRTVYSKDGSRVILVQPGVPSSGVISQPPAAETSLRLPAFLEREGGRLDPIRLNQLKLKILALLKMAQEGQMPSFSLDDLYIHGDTLNPAVDLFGGSKDSDPQAQLACFHELLTRHKLFFIKPDKEYFPAVKQEQLQDAFFAFVMEKLASHVCVKKIFILGSSANRRSGRYKVPFVHFDWAKLNSDFDIYIELDPDSTEPLPAEWEKKFFWQRAGCDYYHFGDVGEGMSSEYARKYPGIRFYEHLVEGYLFHPLTGDKVSKEKWLAEINARCIFTRDRVADWVRQQYGVDVEGTERFAVASFNRVYHVFSQPDDYVLKIYDSKYLTKQNRERVSYEIGLLDALQHSGLEIALPVKNLAGKYISQKDKEQAVLFTHVRGRYVATPSLEENMLAGNLLARLHNEARSYKTKYASTYSNKQLLFYWLGAWKEYHDQGGVVGTDFALNIPYYTRRLNEFNAFPTHCHGDLSPINYLFDDSRCWLIDFQNIGYGPALIDLANGMVEFSARKRAFERANGDAFRKGYESIRKLSATENEFLTDLLVIQIAVRQAKLIRLHYGGFGYELKEDRILGLRAGLAQFVPV